MRSPSAWLSGILTPLISHAVPAGQGLVELSLFLGLGGGSLSAYALALVVVFLSLLAAYLVTYPVMKPLALVLPSVVLFFSARSFGTYLIALLPAAIVAAGTIQRSPALPRRPKPPGMSTRRDNPGHRCGATGNGWSPEGRRPQRWRFWWCSSTPLPCRSTSPRCAPVGKLATVVEIGMSVTNNAGTQVQPHFSVDSGGTLTSFWVTRGPKDLAPGHRANYVLLAPNFYAQPPITGGFQVVALTSNPDSVSRSGTYRPTTSPREPRSVAVNGVVPVGRPVTHPRRPVELARRPGGGGRPADLPRTDHLRPGRA